MHLLHDLRAVADARRQLAHDLDEPEIERQVVQDAVLVFSELASNAVEHGGPHSCGHFEVAWCLFPERLRITVQDFAEHSGLREELLTRMRPGAPSLSEARGRGLAIVDHVCDNWGADISPDGVRVTAELRFPRAG